MSSSDSADGSSQSATRPSWLALHSKVLVFAGLGLVTFLPLFIFVSLSAVPGGEQPGTPAPQPITAGAILAIITAAAIAIERTIETFWSLVGQLLNGWWPFNKILKEVTALEADIDGQLERAQTALQEALRKANEQGDAAAAGLEQARSEMAKLRSRVAELKKLAPGNQRVSLIAATVIQGLGMVDQYQPKIDLNLRLIDQSVAGLTDFVASFKENPARRMINIWAGAMIGLVVAYLMRLDVFLAVLGEGTNPGTWLPYLGVALTGLIIGLGSNPTHDVIAALQEAKKYRASQNQGGPVNNESVAVESSSLPAGFAVVQPAAGSEMPAPPPVRRFR